MRDNCNRMREKARASGVIFRPHVKTHKTVEGARMQHGGGFGPITVSTLAEAEFFAAGGFRDITYAMPIAPEKLWRAAELASRIDRLNLLIDSEPALRAMEERGHPFDVFLKIDCGYHRAGVSPDSPDSVALARAMLQSPVIRFQGLLTHAGHSYNARNIDDVRRIAAEESACLTRFRALDEELSPLIRSVGSTPTASVVKSFTEVDEVRPGNYVFYDAFQTSIGSCNIDDVAVSVLATVVGSYPERRSAIVDAGCSRDVERPRCGPHRSRRQLRHRLRRRSQSAAGASDRAFAGARKARRDRAPAGRHEGADHPESLLPHVGDVRRLSPHRRRQGRR